jgi:Large eukaryotic DNA virus major capsid protein
MAVPAQFSHQVTRLQFPKDVHFGDDTTIWIAKAGDVALGNMYLRVAWPVSCTVDDSAGTRMIDFVELRHENELLERHYGESIEIINDISVPQAKQSVLTNLLGKGITSNLASYYIRMPFRLNLPLCALKKPPIFRVRLRPTNEFSSITWTAPVRVDLFVDYVYVTQAERDYFKKTPMDHLTHTIQRLQFDTPTFLTEFTRPVKELYWVIQNVGASSYDFTNNGAEQLVSLNMTFNGIQVIKNEFGTPMYLRNIQGLENHTRIPDRKFYMYSFSLDPENTDPTGELNMTAISNQLHQLTLSPSTQNRQIRVYALTHNVVRVSGGKAISVFGSVQEGGTKLLA